MDKVDYSYLQGYKEDDKAKSRSYYSLASPTFIDKDTIQFMKESSNKKKDDVRVCMHMDSKSDFHDMVILQRKGCYRRPHKHLNKGETWHIIEGAMAVFVFNDFGHIIDKRILSPSDMFLYRLDKNMYHTAIPLSKYVIYHESKLGPFLKNNDSIYPDWSPVAGESSDAYQLKLLEGFL